MLVDEQKIICMVKKTLQSKSKRMYVGHVSLSTLQDQNLRGITKRCRPLVNVKNKKSRNRVLWAE